MNDMFEQGRLTLFASWLTQADPEIRAYACLCISNLARTGPSRQRERTARRMSACAESSGERAAAEPDAHCRRIAESDLIPQFIALLASENAMEQNAAVGVFRNIALPSMPAHSVALSMRALIRDGRVGGRATRREQGAFGTAWSARPASEPA